MVNVLYNNDDDSRVSSPTKAMEHSASKIGSTAGLSNVAGTVANVATNALTGNTAVGSGVGSATRAGLSGASAAQTAEAGARGVANSYGYNALSNSLGAAAAPVMAVGNAVFDKAMGRDVNVEKTAVTSLGSMFGSLLGSMAVPGLGSMLGMATGAMAKSSYEDGVIGDGLNSRSEEGARDRAENDGFSRSQTADMAAEDRAAGSFAGRQSHSSGYSVSPGLQENDVLGQAAQGAFGDPDAIGDGSGNDNGDSDSDNDGSGAGGATGGDKDGGRY